MSSEIVFHIAVTVEDKHLWSALQNPRAYLIDVALMTVKDTDIELEFANAKDLAAHLVEMKESKDDWTS